MAFRTASQIAIEYRASPLSQGEAEAKGLAAARDTYPATWSIAPRPAA